MELLLPNAGSQRSQHKMKVMIHSAGHVGSAVALLGLKTQQVPSRLQDPRAIPISNQSDPVMSQ